MKVALRDIPCQKRVELGAEFIGAAVAGLPMRAALERPERDPEAGSAVAELHFYADGENVFARGRLEGWIDVACSRCVGPVRLVVSEALNVTYVPASKVPSDEEEGDLAEAAAGEEDDLDVYPYDPTKVGEEVDLEPLLREQIVLAVPFAPLCSEDCKGLCPACGTDLNTGSCTCERGPIDPRWSALKNLKI